MPAPYPNLGWEKSSSGLGLLIKRIIITPLPGAGTRPYHVFMVQSRDQWLESSGTALASGYHNFVQIKALGKKMGLSRHQKVG